MKSHLSSGVKLLDLKHVCIRIPSPVPLARLPCYMRGTRYNSVCGRVSVIMEEEEEDSQVASTPRELLSPQIERQISDDDDLLFVLAEATNSLPL